MIAQGNEMSDSQEESISVGTRGDYEWLVSSHTLDDLLWTCPQVVLGRRIAVTSCDSGPLPLNDVEKAAGWESRNDIAYIPTVTTVDGLPHDQYDEWCVFEKPPDHLGRLVPPETNIFEVAPCKREVHVFVSFGGRVLTPEMKDLAALFWQQLDWIRPESYIADGDFLTFTSWNKALFAWPFAR
jgi:hypothetical protein